MGDDTPTEPPEIDPLKWYCVTVNAYQGGGPPFDCTMDFFHNPSCCVSGAFLKGWIDLGLECEQGWELCVQTGFSAQLLVNVSNPFDTRNECFANCPGEV